MLRAGSEVISELSKPFPAPEVTQGKSQEFLSQLKVRLTTSYTCPNVGYLIEVYSLLSSVTSVYLYCVYQHACCIISTCMLHNI